MNFSIFEILIMISGVVLFFWGIIHQLIVGAAVTVAKTTDETEIEILLFSWISHGGFISFLGLCPVVMVFLYGISGREVRSLLILVGIALLFLLIHSIATGVKKFPRPLKIGFILQFVCLISISLALIFS